MESLFIEFQKCELNSVIQVWFIYKYSPKDIAVGITTAYDDCKY